MDWLIRKYRIDGDPLRDNLQRKRFSLLIGCAFEIAVVKREKSARFDEGIVCRELVQRMLIEVQAIAENDVCGRPIQGRAQLRERFRT